MNVEDTDVERPQRYVTVCIVIRPQRVEVHLPIELDCETLLGTIEVQDERSNGVLPPELATRQPATADCSPQGALGHGASPTQGSSVRERIEAVAHAG